MSYVVELNTADDFKKFKKNNKRAIIFYSADYCVACHEVKDLYYRIAARYHKRAAFAIVDIEKVGLDFETLPIFDSYHKEEGFSTMIGADIPGLKNYIIEVINAK